MRDDTRTMLRVIDAVAWPALLAVPVMREPHFGPIHAFVLTALLIFALRKLGWALDGERPESDVRVTVFTLNPVALVMLAVAKAFGRREGRYSYTTVTLLVCVLVYLAAGLIANWDEVAARLFG